MSKSEKNKTAKFAVAEDLNMGCYARKSVFKIPHNTGGFLAAELGSHGVRKCLLKGGSHLNTAPAKGTEIRKSRQAFLPLTM